MKIGKELRPDERELLNKSISHFKEIARSNRFAENGSINHDVQRCVVCQPELVSLDPFQTYLHLIAECVKVRRPALDSDLVSEINRDLELAGESNRVSLEELLQDDSPAAAHWRNWIREALATGLGLISVHGPSSHDFDLDEEEDRGRGEWIQSTINEIREYQKANAATAQ